MAPHRTGRLPAMLDGRLRLPLIAAPMFLVSGPELVIACCRAGVIGSFPTANCRTTDELDDWLTRMTAEVATFREANPGLPVAPVAANLIVHRSNPRVAEDLALLARYRIGLVIASVGSPEHVVGPVHDYGGLVLADVASMRHVEKAAAAGADGLILLTAGAGGQTGWANPFAFVRAARAAFDGPIVLAGGIADGVALRAAETLGADLAYMGTRFIATRESMASEAYKRMVVEARLDDITLTRAFTGLPTSMLTGSIVAAGLDPLALPERGAIDIAKDINPEARGKRRWRDIWSAGHSAEGVGDVPAVARLVERLVREYDDAEAGRATGRG
ncbi:NAD(P)H-dependent flavin oxidoreductase [Oceanibacterium hippocampi]|uniref:Nitronate monooxygenase n=1 Tax=Oceanibacterium hippocampi TaxID=745714 RepID=A0A1Y5RIK6_9PROT|nr:nitronate monooxygenase [Oceanibacterium hippocampi]SLN18152.1 Nitronate monooxygenase [Oceanibacterium hippocampi]